LHRLLKSVLDEQSAEFLLNPSQFSKDEIGLRESARKACKKAGKDWQINNENVPELIQQARANLDQGEIDVAQKTYLRYLKQFKHTDSGDEEEFFIYEAASSWALPYAYLYASARKNAVGLDVDQGDASSVEDAVDEAIQCSAHAHFRDGIKKKTKRNKHPFVKVSSVIKKLRKDVSDAGKQIGVNKDLSLDYRITPSRLIQDVMLVTNARYGEIYYTLVEENAWHVVGQIFGSASIAAAGIYLDERRTLCRAIGSQTSDIAYMLHCKSMGMEYLEAFNNRAAITKAFGEIEAASSNLVSAEVESRLADFRLRQRKHYEMVDMLTRTCMFDMPFAIQIVSTKANILAAERVSIWWPTHDEAELKAAALDFCRFSPHAHRIVDRGFTHKKWMEINSSLKERLGEKSFEDLKARASTLPDIWGMPDNKDLQDSGK